MDLEELQWNWDELGKSDPLWAILTRQGKEGNRWDIQEFFDTGRKRINELFQYLESRNIVVRNRSALDFGCGVGRLTQPLAGRFDQVAGVDIAPSMIQLANRYNQYPQVCTYHLNTKNDLLLFKDNSFDFILTIIVLQHMKPDFAKNYIKEFARLLTPGGIAIFQLPTRYIGPVYTPPKLNLYQKMVSTLKLIFNTYRKLLFPLPFAGPVHMEMYGIAKEEVLSFLATLPIEIVDLTDDNGIAANWESTQYIIKKI